MFAYHWTRPAQISSGEFLKFERTYVILSSCRIPVLVLEIIVFLLAAYKGILELKNGAMYAPRLLQILIRDSLAYFTMYVQTDSYYIQCSLARTFKYPCHRYCECYTMDPYQGEHCQIHACLLSSCFLQATLRGTTFTFTKALFSILGSQMLTNIRLEGHKTVITDRSYISGAVSDNLEFNHNVANSNVANSDV